MISTNIPSREKKILSILNARHGIVSGKELSTKIGVSERTIRSDISHINSALADLGIQIQAVHSKGYTIQVKDRSTLLEIFSDEQNFITKDDRITALLLKLLRHDDWYNLGELEDEMFVSNTTLEKDIKVLNKIIFEQHPYLKVERKLNSIRLEDDEHKKRDLLTRYYAKNWDYDSTEGIVLKQDEFGGELLKEVQKVVKKTLHASGTHLDDFAFIYLSLAIAVMIFRVKNGHFINSDDKAFIDEDIRIVLDRLSESQEVSLLPGEYHYLSQIKEQLVFLCLKTYSKNYVLNNTDIRCHEIVNNLLEDLLRKYGIDFTEDDKLFVDLTRHVQALVSGIVAPHLQNHVLGDELRKKNPFLGDIAHYMRCCLSKKCEIALGIEEEDYLLPFIMLSEEARYKKKRGEGIPTAVVSHYNESMTHYLMETLNRHYGGILKLDGPYAMYNKELIDKDQVRLVLTTVKVDAFKKYFNTPSLTVSPLIDEKDQAEIDLYLTSLKNHYLYKVPQKQMEAYFLKDLCYRLPDKSNLTSAISSIEGKIKDLLGLDSLKPFDMEEDYYCSLSNGLLFCYQITNQVQEPAVSLVDLGKDLSSKHQRNIKTVMYMLMPEKDMQALGWFYYMAMAFAWYPQELRSVFEGTSVEDLSFNISRGIEESKRIYED
ncbi:MAG: HTH domain-containing protein [Pseudobutyrivibrio sp.]|nr:HTH domain-containing protein [Pseudobutyrivibrio sp.]